MSRPKIAAVTHARQDDYFLSLWLHHYGAQIGYENCHMILDGSDWTPSFDLAGGIAHVIERPRSNMHRIRVDRRMARLQLELIDKLFFEEGYDYVIRGDCDEFVVCEPDSGKTLFDVVGEADATGYVYSSGVDVIHNTKFEGDLDPAIGILAQRKYGLLSQAYSKVNLLSRKARQDDVTFNAGGHRASGDAVIMSQDYLMFHLGWADKDLLRQRIAPRFANDRDDSFADYLNARQAIFHAVADHEAFLDFDSSLARAKHEIATQGGRPAQSAQRLSSGNFYWSDQHMLAVKIPSRFGACLKVSVLDAE